MQGSELNQREENILNYILEKTKTSGYPPSVREIGSAVGLKSPSSVHMYLNNLEAKGYLRRDPAKNRAIEIIKKDLLADKTIAETSGSEIVNIPLVGSITAGEPILAVENIEETLPFSLNFFTGQNELFSLKVKGESMIEAGILDGDMIIVEKQDFARNGEIVAALLDEEATVKRFFKENGHFRLQPENATMEPIIVNEVKILGKVVGLYRKIS